MLDEVTTTKEMTPSPVEAGRIVSVTSGSGSDSVETEKTWEYPMFPSALDGWPSGRWQRS